ncbi:putative WD repeat-containing protein C13G6.08 [Erysiphe neolycopersici]|uniref:Putative WD repeat-containing protein C13G6.08 n=1 Tax=Erysiphe neolycopersici TaxID=212602 RepID=A0A420HWX2_9PEZI|nr:putative WD repeat-containing protein C13G6.08 [Erysiphe neolycopersici]
MVHEKISYYQEDVKINHLHFTNSCEGLSTSIHNQKINKIRVKEPYSWTIPKKVFSLVKAYGYDGSNDGYSPPGDSSTFYLSQWSKNEKISATARMPRIPNSPCSKTFGSQSTYPGALDRFLPTRWSPNTPTESFRANKDPHTLSSDERLKRNQLTNLDAFGFRRRHTPCTNTSRRSTTGNFALGERNVSGSGTFLTLQRNISEFDPERRVSVGTVWRVGGAAPTTGILNGRRGLLAGSTNAPLYTTSFSTRPEFEDDEENLENRLAEALSLDRTTRVFEYRYLMPPKPSQKKTSWDQFECQWVSSESPSKDSKREETRNLPLTPFKVLDAPNLRDDFYCSVLAYSITCHTLAVALGPLLYAWSEKRGVHLLNAGSPSGTWLTSLAFSSDSGKKCILAFGRSNGSLGLMSLYDSMLPRFEVKQPHSIACLTWRPQVTTRSSKSPITPRIAVKTEDLLVGDEVGHVYYYSIEWPECWEVARNGWSGSMTLLSRISVHSQQICGLSFSADGSLFATGGNDNLCCLFQTNDILNSMQEEQATEIIPGIGAHVSAHMEIRAGSEKYRWVHGAAVKVIAFCPWKEGLLATGGGSNDKCIHFYHASSGASLATISVSAQVTSLIWSNTRREICATFGYAQPEHPYRIAVFSWPDCKQVLAIPWEGEHRALYAIPYLGGPNESHTSREGGAGLSRTALEGCIVVASSDESIKFHEIWAGNKKTTATVKGLLGGSDVIEGLEIIDKEGEIIR